MAPEIRTARLPSGLTLPYAEQGDPDGTPVVLLHGYADSWRSFELVLPFLPDSVHAFAPSQRGHGDADRPASGYDPDQLAGDLLGFMDAVGLRAAVLAASSSAGFTVQRFAVDHPDRTLGLVLIGVPWTMGDKPGPARFMSDLASVTEPLDPTFVRTFVESTASGLVPRAFVETMTRESQKLPLHVWKAALQELMVATPAAETATITAPTLVLYGNRDAFVPRSDQESLTAAIPGSRLITYDGIGHMVHWDEPRRVASDIIRFASRVASRQA
jgi:pimeloyl-ACP methyl ester carboxylesterase